jgi:hypothetical protein
MGAFENCTSLTSIDLSAVTSKTIGRAAFKGCTALDKVTLPTSGLTTIDDIAFEGCEKLTSIGAAVTEVSTGLITLNLDASTALATIGTAAFEGTGLTSVKLPESVTAIGVSAFQNCGSLTSITVKSAVPAGLGNSAFENTAITFKIYVPNANLDAYKGANVWKTYADKNQIVGN